MPTYLTNAQFWIDLWPMPIFAAVISGLAALAVRGEGSFWHKWLVTAAFSALGLVVGQLTGQSREPAVAATIGAVLTLLGGVMIYVLGVHGAAKQALSAAAVGALAASLLLGAYAGAALRQSFDDFRNSPEFKIRRELEENYLRERYGIPAPPSPQPAPADH